MHRFFTVLLAVLGALAADASGAAPAPPSPAGDVAAKVDAVFADYDRSDSPGCALGVFRDGRIAYARGYGMANLELSIGLTSQSVLDLGSTAKQFAAFAIHLLAREGKLSLDDDVRKWVPEVPEYDKGKPIRISHLLHHTGGLRDYLELFEFAGVRDEDLTTSDDALAIIARQKAPNFAPGAEHVYSNTGYFLLSVIVKRASGMSLRDFAAARIFGPLGMTHTQYVDDHALIVPNRATGYSKRPAGGFAIAMSDFEQNGDGGILTSVEDLQRWDENFYSPKVGDRALLDAMLVPGKLNDGRTLEYASGLYSSNWRGLPTVLHGGAWVGYRAQLMRFPSEHFSVACVCNLAQANPSALARKVAAVYLADKLKPEEPATPAAAAPPQGAGAAPYAASAAELEARAGAYQSRETGQLVKVSVREGRLVVDGGGERIVLSPVGPGRFAAQGPEPMTVAFEGTSGTRGPARVTTGEAGDTETEVFDPVAAAAPSAAELAAYAGTYVSAELETTWRIVLQDGKLFLKYRNAPKDPLTPTVRDGFAVDGDTLAFSRGSGGKVTGFKLGAGRVRGIAFARVAGP